MKQLNAGAQTQLISRCGCGFSQFEFKEGELTN